MKASRLIPPLAALAALSVVPAAVAADDLFRLDEPGFFVGAGVGVNRVEDDQFPNDADDIDDSNETYKIPFGFRLNRYFAAEAQYIDFGTAEGGSSQNDVDAKGFTAGLVGTAPITRWVHPYAKVGALAWDADRRLPAGTVGQQVRDGDGVDFTYGLGVKVPFTEHFDVRAEYERFEFGDFEAEASDPHLSGVDVDQASVAVVYTF